jgi:hypothetical protein
MTPVRVFALLTMSAALCLLIPKSVVYVIPIIFILLFLLSFMLLSVNGGPLLFVASLGASATFFWYFILCYNIRNSPTAMPDSFNNLNIIIASVAALHCLFILIGNKFYQFTWITMATLVGLLTMQHVNILYFKTDG